MAPDTIELSKASA